MSTLYAFFLCAILAVSIGYKDLDDTIDFEAMMNTPSELRAFLDCLLDAIPCPPKFLPYRKHAEEAFNDSCRECTTLQKHHGKQVLSELKNMFPKDFEKFVAKYDSGRNHTHFNKLEREVEKF